MTDDAAVDAPTQIHTTATEFAFEPDHWTVSAGQEVVLELVNDGNVEHDWVVLEQGTEIAGTGEFDDSMVVWELKAEAGETVTDTFTAPEPGTYPVVCTVRGLRAAHYVAGMEGTLEVVE